MNDRLIYKYKLIKIKISFYKLKNKFIKIYLI